DRGADLGHRPGRVGGECVRHHKRKGERMDRELLESRFARMGARLKVQERASRGRSGSTMNMVVDMQRDRKGEFFEISLRPAADVRLEVVDLQPSQRHLLLMAEEGNRKLKFVCGHDERQWFVAAVPEEHG